MKIHCPACEGIFRVEGHSAGADFQCPFCKASFSFRDKETVVAQGSPDTVVRVERDTPPPPREAAAGDPPNDHPRRTPPRVTPLPDPALLTDMRVGDVVAGSYRLDSVIGCGGMSVVFKARQLSLDRNVALKVLRKDLCQDREFTQRFLKEARALAELSHPHIVQVIDQGVHRGNHFLVMEYIEGASLREVLNERRLSPAEALRIVPSLCAALEYAHGKGIIHRDIKPENLMLARDGSPKIADFGLARLLGTDYPELTRLTKTQTILGTIDYMAPEQREGSPDIDHRADIYSLGVVFYEMLTGELPIARFPLPSERVQVDVRLDEVVLKVLQKDREQRYQHASLVATDLQRIEREPGASGAHMPDRHVVLQRMLKMGQSPLFFFLTLIFVLMVVVDRRGDITCLVTGLYAPFLAVQMVRHGILPRLSLGADLFLVRHPIPFFGALAVATLVLSRVLGREATQVLCGLFLSSAVCMWRTRSWLLRGPGQPAFMPGFETPGAASQGAWAKGNARVPPSVPPPPVFHGQSPKLSPVALSPRAPGHPPPLPAGAAGDRTEAESTMDMSTDASRVSLAAQHASHRSADEPAPGTHVAPHRQRLSWLAVLGFLLTIATLVYAVGVWIVFAALDWPTVASAVDIRFGELRNIVADGLWQTPVSQIARLPSLLTLGLLLPLAIPALVFLLALIPLQSPRKRGGWLVMVGCGMLTVQALALVQGTAPMRGEARGYARLVEDGLEDGGLVDDALEAARAERRPVARLAWIHRAVVQTRAGLPYSEGGRTALLGIARNANLPAVERMVALAAVDEIYRGSPWDAPGSASDSMRDGVTAALAEDNRLVRCAFLEVLSACPDDRLRELYWTALGEFDCGESAVRWWTGAASLDAIQWLGRRYRTLSAHQLAHWVNRLEHSRDLRFLEEPELRRALLEPLLDLGDSSFHERLVRLIEYGPRDQVR